MTRKIIKLLFILTGFSFSIFMKSCTRNNEADFEDHQVIRNITIYNPEKMYCAFCDMVYYMNKYYIAFRVGPNHAPSSETDINGFIKIMSSSDAISWHDELDISDDDWDLRDPCFCINSRNELTLNYGVHKRNEKPAIKNYRVNLSFNGDRLSVEDIRPIDAGEYSNYWIWKIYFHDNKYWGVGYYEKENAILMNSEDGVNYKVCSIIPGFEGEETALVFKDNSIYAFTRNVKQYEKAYMSISQYPYQNWETTVLNKELSGPETCEALDEIFVAARGESGVSVYKFDQTEKNLNGFINLFANGSYYDKGYTGMLYHDGFLNVVYYACNDFSSYPSIYLTRIKLL